MKQKNNCEALPDIITQGIMRVHLLSNTAVTKSRKQCLLVGLFTVPLQLYTFLKAGAKHQKTTPFTSLSGTIPILLKTTATLAAQ